MSRRRGFEPVSGEGDLFNGEEAAPVAGAVLDIAKRELKVKERRSPYLRPFSEQRLTGPTRSLNLCNAVAVVVYQAIQALRPALFEG